MAATHDDGDGQCRASGAGPHGASAAVTGAICDATGLRGCVSHPAGGLWAGQHDREQWDDRGVQGGVVVCQGRSTTMSWDREDMQNRDNVLDALADWESGLFDEQDAAIQRKLDAE